MNHTSHIYPSHDQQLSREKKEWLLQQQAHVFWFTGLSGSGKTTIASAVEKILHDLGYMTVLLDGDNMRTGLNSDLGFSEADRFENIRRVAEVAKLLAENGIIVLACFISPSEAIREVARNIITLRDYREIFIDTPLEICEARDVKGLYSLARKGAIKDFTGITAPFDLPTGAALKVTTSRQTLDESVQRVMQYILPLVAYQL